MIIFVIKLLFLIYLIEFSIMSMEFVQIAEDAGEEPMELPVEEDGTLLLSTLQAQFPGSSGLKYRNSETRATRGIRLNEGRLHPPSIEDGWGEQVYLCVFPKGNGKYTLDHHSSHSYKTHVIEVCFRGFY